MFAGIDVAAERHVLAWVDAAGEPLGRPIAFDEDASGYRTLIEALGTPPALVVIEATGHYWKNLYATLAAAGHDVVLLNPIVARRGRWTWGKRGRTRRRGWRRPTRPASARLPC
jgi:transposase